MRASLFYIIIFCLKSCVVFGSDFKPCIDDSDCVELGHAYACFLYMCYPWKDPRPSHPNCFHDRDCFDGQGKCVKHHNPRRVERGVCFHSLNECNDHEECTADQNCCHQHCCPSEYFQEWKKLPCLSDEYCANLHLGLSCCPDTHRCCDVQSQQLTSSADNVTLVEVTVIEPLPEEDYVVEEVINTSVTVPVSLGVPKEEEEDIVTTEVNPSIWGSSSTPMENFTTSPPSPSTPEPPPPDLVLQVEVVPEESRLPETIDTSTTTFSTTSTTTIATTTAGSIPSSSAKTTAATTASTAMVSSSSSSSTSSPTTPQSGKSILMDVLASGSPATTEESHKVVSDSLSETELQLQKCLREVSEFDKIRENQIILSSSLRSSDDINNLTINDMFISNLTVNDMAINDISINDMTVNVMTINDLTVNDMTIYDLTINDMTINDLTLNDLTINDMTITGLTIDDLAINDLTINDMTFNNLHINDMTIKGMTINNKKGDLLLSVP